MKKYKFRLEAVLMMRKRDERLALKEITPKLKEHFSLNSQKQEVDQLYKSSSGDIRHVKTGVRETMREYLKKIDLKIGEVEKELIPLREKLLLKRRDRIAIEQMRDSQRKAYKKELEKGLTIQRDDWYLGKRSE